MLAAFGEHGAADARQSRSRLFDIGRRADGEACRRATAREGRPQSATRVGCARRAWRLRRDLPVVRRNRWRRRTDGCGGCDRRRRGRSRGGEGRLGCERLFGPQRRLHFLSKVRRTIDHRPDANQCLRSARCRCARVSSLRAFTAERELSPTTIDRRAASRGRPRCGLLGLWRLCLRAGWWGRSLRSGAFARRRRSGS